MGNSASSGRAHHDDSVDYGSLSPQGVYTGPRDWNQAIVSQLIVARKLAPFYRPLEDYEESWDDDQILAARKELPDHDNDTLTRIEATHTTTSKSGHTKRPGLQKEPCRPDAAIYRGAVECPICFLYYPPNINHSRCCDQAICTECFVQIKRSEPTTTHVVSEPAACPYCVQENFGVVYTPPPWRAGLGSEGSPTWSESPRGSQQSVDTASSPPTHKRRQKSFSADSPEVVTTDQIRPDWEAKLAAVRAAVARRANRRIIMRQVGDRLIPVGVTSGRVHALSPEEAANAEASEGGGSRRSRRRQQAPQGYEQYVGMSGQDLEELMIMEAMRLSLIEHEEQQKKEAEEKKKKEAEAAASAGAVEAQFETSGTSSESQAAPGPGPSTLEARSSAQPSATSSIPSSTFLSPDESTIPDRAGSPGQNADSRSTSRARTPPPNVNSSSSLLDDSSSVWRSQTPSPSPFSAAALASASTAAAFLGTRSVEGSSTASNDRESTTSTSPTSVPSITLGAEETTKPNDAAAAPIINPFEDESAYVYTPGTQDRADTPNASLSNTISNQTSLTSNIYAATAESRNKGLLSEDVPNQSSSEGEV